MLDIAKLSNRYAVRLLCDSDADDILALCLENTQYYEYCGKQTSKERILNDLHITPPGIGRSAKYYVGFYDGPVLAAVMDLIDGYPSGDCAFIGFFMMNKRLQGRGRGTELVQEICRSLKEADFRAVRLGIDKGNPQSTHFWKKNGFLVIDEVERDEGTILVAEKKL